MLLEIFALLYLVYDCQKKFVNIYFLARIRVFL